MTRAITYTLWLEEPCLAAAPGGDPNTESSLDYIPGGAIRGALAAAYLRNGGKDDRFNALFLDGRVRYLNAYPILHPPKATSEGGAAVNSAQPHPAENENAQPSQPRGVRGLPTPRAWAMKKGEEKTAYNRFQLTAQQREILDDSFPKAFKRPFVEPSATAEMTSIFYPDIAYEVAVHTARNRQKGRALEGDDQSALFRYKALARDQAFAGAIVLDGEEGDDFDKLQELLTGVMPVGGSHMAGYGLARIGDVKVLDQWREGGELPPTAVAAGGSFIVYLASHAILYDPATGQPTGDIRLFLPGKKDDYTIAEEDSFAASTWVGGFNKHRGLPLTQQWAVQMGSAWRITTTKTLDADELANLEHTGIGTRTEEGFGRVIVNPIWPGPSFQAEKWSLITAPEVLSQLGPDVEALLQRMNERLARRELDRLLANKVNRMAQKNNVRGHLSRSQLGRLQVRIRRPENKDSLTDFLTYLDGTRKRKSADDQFRKYRVDEENFRDYLQKLAEKPAAIWGAIGAQSGSIPQVGKAAYILDDKLAHEYTVRFISKLCRQLSKLEVEP